MLPGPDCGANEDVCCNVLYDVAYHILVSVHDSLVACFPQDGCSTIPVAYVTMGGGDDGVRDALTVAIIEAVPSPKSLDPNGRMVGIPLYRCAYEVRLKESGWPMVERNENSISPPDPVRQNSQARHAFSHGERIYRKLNNMLITKTMTPSTVAQYSTVQLGRLTPLRPLGGVVGWVIPVSVDLPWGWAE